MYIFLCFITSFIILKVVELKLQLFHLHGRRFLSRISLSNCLLITSAEPWIVFRSSLPHGDDKLWRGKPWKWEFIVLLTSPHFGATPSTAFKRELRKFLALRYVKPKIQLDNKFIVNRNIYKRFKATLHELWIRIKILNIFLLFHLATLKIYRKEVK